MSHKDHHEHPRVNQCVTFFVLPYWFSVACHERGRRKELLFCSIEPHEEKELRIQFPANRYFVRSFMYPSRASKPKMNDSLVCYNALLFYFTSSWQVMRISFLKYWHPFITRVKHTFLFFDPCAQDALPIFGNQGRLILPITDYVNHFSW